MTPLDRDTLCSALFMQDSGGVGRRRRKASAQWNCSPKQPTFDGPILAISRARIAMTCGDNDTAIELLDRSLVTPYGMPVHELRLDPTWDKLRADPRF